jgi:outer membrane protein assembly factor BamB
MNNYIRLVVLAISITGLVACSSDKRPPLKGDRISVLQLQNNMDVDKKAQAITIQLADIKENTAWPQMGGNASHTPQHLGLGSKLSRIWSTNIGTGSGKRNKLITPPIVAMGRVYASDSEGVVTALDLTSGKRIWETDLLENDDATVSTGLTYAVDTLFVTNGVQSLYALDPNTGQKRWSKNLKSALRGSPTFNNGRLYVITLDDQTLALDPTNGETLWRHQGVTEAAGLLGTPSPAAVESVVISAYNSGDISALRAETGQEAWSDNLTGIAEFQGRSVTKLSGFRGHPVLDGDIVMAGNAASRLVAIHVPSGERLWQKEFGISDTPWVSGNVVFVITSQNDLTAIAKETGNVVWTKPLPRFEDPEDNEDPIFWRGPLVAGNQLWIVNNIGQLMAIDPLSGKTLQTTKVTSDIMLSPIVVNNILLLLSDDGDLAAYRS